MKVITLRNIPPPVERLIERRSVQTGLSLNKTVIRLLEELLGAPDTGAADDQRDLDELAGAWSEKDAREFDRILAEQRRVDPELWE